MVRPPDDLGVSTMEWIKQNKGYLTLLIFSVIWVSGAIWLLISDFTTESFHHKDITLNELGDYLAGAFSPLAFLWLVYGYFMQNHELKANTKTANNAENLSKSQFHYLKTKDENLYQPIFTATIIKEVPLDETSKNLVLKLKIEGSPVFNVSIESQETKYEYKTILAGDEKEIIVTINENEAIMILRKINNMLELPLDEITDELERTITLRRIPIKYTDRIGLRNYAELLIQHSNVKYKVDINNAIKQQEHLYVD